MDDMNPDDLYILDYGFASGMKYKVYCTPMGRVWFENRAGIKSAGAVPVSYLLDILNQKNKTISPIAYIHWNPEIADTEEGIKE